MRNTLRDNPNNPNNYTYEYSYVTEDWTGVIRPSLSYEDDSTQVDTVPMDPRELGDDYYVPNDLEAVRYSVNAEEAIQCYRSRYPMEAIKLGMVSPEEATAMLVEISDTHADSMTPSEKDFIEAQAAKTVHEIVKDIDLEQLHELPDEQVPTMPTLYRMIDVVDMLQREDDKVVAMNAEADLKTAIAAVKVKGGAAIVANIEKALDHYDDPENDDALGVLVATIEVFSADMAQQRVEMKLDKAPASPMTTKSLGLQAAKAAKVSSPADGNGTAVLPVSDLLSGTDLSRAA